MREIPKIRVKGHYRNINGKRIWVKPHLREPKRPIISEKQWSEYGKAYQYAKTHPKSAIVRFLYRKIHYKKIK